MSENDPICPKVTQSRSKTMSLSSEISAVQNPFIRYAVEVGWPSLSPEDDLRYYHLHGPELLALTQLFALTHLVQFYYGATWNTGRKGLFNWRDEQAGDFETLVKTFVAPRRVLRIVSDFILFTRKDDELAKVVLRPHQMRAAERCFGRAKDPEETRGL